MSHMPKWMTELITKGSSVKDCLELEKVRLAHEREERQAKRDRDKWEAEKEIKLKELALKERELETGPSPQSVQTPSVKLPKFEGQDPDVFLKSYEKIAGLQKWDKSQWAVRLVPMLSGKALEAYSRLSDEESDNYDAIKTAILKRYELTSEAYRDKFRKCRQFSDESFKDFVVLAERFFHHWCDREDIGSDYELLFDLILREQVIGSGLNALQLWVREHTPKSIKDVITLSESFQVAHKGSNAGGGRGNAGEKPGPRPNKFVSGKVHALCLDSPFADVIIGNNVSIVVPKEAAPLSMIETAETVDEEECGVVQTRLETRKQEDAKKPKLDDLKEVDTEHEGMWCNRKKLIEHQKTDDSLKSVLEMAQNGPHEGKSYFILKNDLLYRVFDSDSGEKVFQIVAPKKLRSSIMSLAHDTPLAGHLGNKKTRERIMRNFFWPEAFPMKNQDAESVANALIEMLSSVGFPKEILSDQGTNFMSSLISELCKMLKVRKLSTTPYHPQANGLVERFNGTLKQMLKAYAVVEPLKWDVHLPYVRFAYREVPNETTGFTPFELLYARHVRGPLDILKERWEEPTEEQTSVLSYLMETRERMETVRKMVTDMESLAKKNQKRYYDKNVRNRNFEVGQKVLVLLPTSTSNLLAQWKGPYEVTQKVSPVDFKVRLSKSKETVYHVNMLKEWFEREPEENSKSEIMGCLNVISILANDDVQIADDVVSDRVPTLQQTESATDVQYSTNQTAEQMDQIQRLVEAFGDIFTDVPKRTHLMKHSLKTSTEVPIQMKPYPIPYALQNKVKRELQQMMDLGIIEETNSPYSAPVVLIKKKDNSLKFISKLDLTKGYWQVPFDDDAKRKSAFVTPFGHFSFTVMPFGMVNAPATFVRLVSKVLTGLDDFTEAFIDDIGIYSNTWEDHLEHLRTVFEALRKANLAARPAKCEFGFNELCFLGHTIGSGKIKPMMSKVEAIQNFPIPTTKKKVKSFLGMIGFYRKFIPNFATVALPLTDLTRRRTPNKIKWTDDLQRVERSPESLR
ncbi:uncharacterized protein [Magallana gigas]|uniref:uncharacterized protein n=1 Tax=Magallana gigas TaxID=29159 RepID=UPI0033428143